MKKNREYLKNVTWKLYEALELEKDIQDYFAMMERAMKFYKEKQYEHHES